MWRRSEETAVGQKKMRQQGKVRWRENKEAEERWRWQGNEWRGGEMEVRFKVERWIMR